MTLPVTKPVLGTPPEQYDPAYLRRVVTALESFFNRLNAAGSIEATTLNLSNVPGWSATELRIGDLFMVDGFLKLYPADNTSGGGGGGSGAALLTGTTAPDNAVGADGDVYFKTSSPVAFYGPKSGGVWPAGTVLEGEDGQDGNDGDNASSNTILNGSGPPSNGLGTNGDFYIDTVAPKTLYGPKSGGVWGSGFVLKGEKGDDGEDAVGGGGGTGNWLGGAMVRRRATGTFLTQPGMIPVGWDAREYDTGYFSDGSPTRLTVPTGVLKVRVSASFRLQGQFGFDALNAKVKVYVTKNGSEFWVGMPEAWVDAQAVNGLSLFALTCHSPVVNVIAGDYFEVGIKLVSSATLSLNDQSYFAIETVEVT